MTIARSDILIDMARDLAIASSYSTTHGLEQDFFVVALKNAHMALQRVITSNVAEIFCDYQEDSIVANQESYTNPTDILASHLMHEVGYMSDGTGLTYIELRQVRQRMPLQYGTPLYWFQDAGATYISPTPSSATGKLRRRYEKRLDSLDVWRGRVKSVAGAAPNYTSIVLETSDPVPSSKLTNGVFQYICVVDWDGTVQCRNIPITAYTSATQTLTIKTGYAAGGSEAIAAGDYIVLGRDTKTHSDLDDVCEDFYVNYMAKAAEAGRSSSDIIDKSDVLQSILNSIVEIYQLKPAGKSYIQESRDDW